MTPDKKILLLTLVHPDFLPPVYAVAQVLRDEGYLIDIVCFESFVPGSFHPGENINIITVGKYHSVSLNKRLRLQVDFVRKCNQLIDQSTTTVVGFCPFSYIMALKVRKALPVLYLALETANYSWQKFFISPLTTYYNWRAIKRLSEADLVATPSYQRSAWLAGRANTDFVPHTIFNSAYLDHKHTDTKDSLRRIYESIVPEDFLGKKTLLYTGNVNSSLCVKEVVESFCQVEDDCRFIITGIKDNGYCNEIKEIVNTSSRRSHVLLLPVLPREQMVALQANADIGVCFFRELDNVLESKMIAPNKTSEYLANGLLLLSNRTFYMEEFASAGIAVLSEDLQVNNISNAIRQALEKINDKGVKQAIQSYVETKFNMRQQLKPVTDYLKNLPVNA